MALRILAQGLDKVVFPVELQLGADTEPGQSTTPVSSDQIWKSA